MYMGGYFNTFLQKSAPHLSSALSWELKLSGLLPCFCSTTCKLQAPSIVLCDLWEYKFSGFVSLTFPMYVHGPIAQCNFAALPLALGNAKLSGLTPCLPVRISEPKCPMLPCHLAPSFIRCYFPLVAVLLFVASSVSLSPLTLHCVLGSLPFLLLWVRWVPALLSSVRSPWVPSLAVSFFFFLGPFPVCLLLLSQCSLLTFFLFQFWQRYLKTIAIRFPRLCWNRFSC